MPLHFHEVTDHFAGAIRAVKAGKEVVLTEQNVPIALIEPLRPASKEEEREIRRMIDSGLLQQRKSGELREWTWKHGRTKAA